MSKEMTSTGISRRSFLKTSAAAVGAASLTGALTSCGTKGEGAQGGSATRTKFATACHGNCHGFSCPLDVFVEDGKVVDIQTYINEEHPEYHAVCQRGYTNIERMYSPLRLKYPMRRVGERGSGEFERISWEEAIEEIATKWKELQAKYGDATVAVAKGSGSFTATSYSYDRLRVLMGATNFLNNYDANGVNSTIKHIGADAFNGFGNEFRNLMDAKKIFCWGCNPSDSATIAYHFVSEAQQKGARLYVIDPVFTATAGRADKYIPIRPGTDGLLALGMMQVILREGLQDEESLKLHSVAPFLTKQDGLYLRQSDLGLVEAGSAVDDILVCDAEGNVGTVAEIANPVIKGSYTFNGIEVTPTYERLLKRIAEYDMAKIVEYTEIPVETIEWLAREFADGPSTILIGFGIDHYVNGITGYINMHTLLDISGNVCKPGAGMTISDLSLPTAQGINTGAWMAPAGAKPSPSLAGAYMYEAVLDGGIGGFNQKITSCIFPFHNIIGNYPDRQTWLEIMEGLELSIVTDIWMTETCRYADLVLPVAFIWELRDLGRNKGNPHVRLMDKCAEPQYESKSDFDIVALLGQAMGFGDKFNVTVDEYLASTLDNDTARSYGVTWDRLLQEGRIWAYETGHVYGEKAYGTKTKRSEFYFENPVPEFNAGLEWDKEMRRLPYWFPPNEAWHENPLFEKYPLIFTSERSRFKVHTQFSYVPMLLELDKEPYIKLNQVDAEKRGIAENDLVRLYNDRGYVVLRAHINNGIRPGVLVIDHGWQDDQFIEGHYSDLSNRKVDAAIPGPAWFDCLCEVEKVQ